MGDHVGVSAWRRRGKEREKKVKGSKRGLMEGERG